MSFEYLECLCSSDQVRYMSKLTALSTETCPYKIPAGSWINDLTKWPSIEWPDVSYYLIETPSVFTRESSAFLFILKQLLYYCVLSHSRL